MTTAEDYIAFTLDDITVYESDIDRLCDDYINGLIDPEKIYKTSVFAGMLIIIYYWIISLVFI